MTAALVLPDVRGTADISPAVNEACEQVVALIADMTDANSVNDVRRKWEAFMRLVDVRRRRSTAKAHAASRIIETHLGRLILDQPAPDSLTSSEVSEMRLMARYSHVVDRIIAEATNGSPATRNRCIKAIRAERMSNGELRPTRRDKDIEAARAAMIRRNRKFMAAAERIERDELARAGTGDLSVAYQRVRQALVAMSSLPDVVDVRLESAAAEALTVAEGHIVSLLRRQRWETERRTEVSA